MQKMDFFEKILDFYIKIYTFSTVNDHKINKNKKIYLRKQFLSYLFKQMALNTSNRVNENERHEKIAVIANDLSNWRYYSHNGKDTAWDFPVTDKYSQK